MRFSALLGGRGAEPPAIFSSAACTPEADGDARRAGRVAFLNSFVLFHGLFAAFDVVIEAWFVV